MKIKLRFDPHDLELIHDLGLRQANPETLRLVHNHPLFKRTVLLRGKTNLELEPRHFFRLTREFYGWIEVESEQTRDKVAALLDSKNHGTDDSILVKIEPERIEDEFIDDDFINFSSRKSAT